MPLIVFAVAAYVAGLLAGFSGSILLAIFASVASALAALRRGRPIAIALAMVCACGAFMARDARVHDEQCARDEPRRSPITLVLDDSAAPGEFVHARFEKCEGRASVGVESGSASAGSVVAVMGVVAKSQSGFVVTHAEVRVLRGPPFLKRWRGDAGRAIDRTFRQDAPLVRALLIADRRELPPEMRDRFAAAGLAHVLAIAGLHIGIIAMALEAAFDAFSIPRRKAAIVSIVTIVFYVAMIGAPVPAVRSASMLVALFASRVAQRPTSRWSFVALGALQPVVDPRVVLEVGYQLSVVGVAAMISAGMLATRLGVARLSRLPRFVATTILSTTIATVATGPVVAWVFGRISIVGPVSNVFAGPMLALAQPIIFCGLVLSPVHSVASLFADAAHPLLVGLDWTAATAAAVPNGSIAVSPTFVAAVVGGAMALATIVACASREWALPATFAASAAVVLVWLPFAPASSGMTELHMIDVGQGDAIALKTPHGHWVLFDAGRAWPGGDAGRATILPYLGRRGASLDMFVLSHPHTDHVGGASSVLHAMRPSRYVDGGFPGPATAYRASLEVARRDGVRWTRAHPGDSVAIDGVTLVFLAPDSSWTASLTDPNLASVVTLVRVGEVRMLMMGDAESPEEQWLLDHAAASLHADILKVGHHGSGTSSSEGFLDAVAPRLSLVSVGTGNSYHLPTPAVMRRLAAHGSEVVRTDQLGSIVVRTDGRRIFVDAGNDSWQVPGISPLRAP
ncbi:MAG: DNA internalization-related competence protein ComEC/Rec2 [Gemmatimonadaceae bacterium]